MLKIWGRKNSSNVRKVLWCAEEAGLAYERIDAGGAFGVVNDAPYRALNPNGVVPTLEDEGFVLWESNTIVRYLAARYAPDLYPQDLQQRASAEKWMDWTTSSLAAPFRTVFWGTVRTPPEQRDPAAIQAALDICAGLLAIPEAVLAKQSYLSGEQFGIGDIPLGCFIYAWFEMPIERPAQPHLKAWYERLKARPAYRDAVMTELT
ncbi:MULTISPECIES: glutathione S-transferase [Pseudomonas]|uniref:glutathione S-transferase n=1 Tax=Pseudomonas TaxID=286 RepID=UPI0007EE5599|nr:MULTISPECIES: glutathione S-transferase [Pseudomonas]MDG9856097.1 glutathione S-transferase [Pseudomonas nitroreducens]MDH1075259.1 glutathione S-transferase [Pseudomonas nitroreducens]NMZ57494.1 glutathione S-transferase [Pseudomonas nitroreducens]NMZ75620.1 glutathione S-transferase [Pseudomonas nitroreducens]NNN24139.1 glutathione S-transferase [Pseudomonas nitroreducens]